MHRMPLRLLVAGLCAIGIARAEAAGTDLWLAPPDISDLATPPGSPLSLVLLGAEQTATVTIDMPANGAFVPIVTTLPASGMVRIDLTAFRPQLETRPTNTITNTGLHVSATQPVGAYYNVANEEIWTLRGSDAAGREFYLPLHRHVPFFNEMSYASPHQAFASGDIVATQNATTVSIYSPLPVDGHPALQQFSVTLNRGQAYSVAWTGSNWNQPGTHPGGAVVLADKPVVVSIKDDAVHNPAGSCMDLLGTQLVPVAALGREYIAVKGQIAPSGDESVVVYATQNNTQVFRDGAATPLATLFAGEYFRVDMDSIAASGTLYLRTSLPAYAVHISGYGCGMGEDLLPPIDRAGSRRATAVRSDNANFRLVVLVPAAASNAFAVAGAGVSTLNPAAFADVLGTNGAWKAASIAYTTLEVPVDMPFTVSNPAGRFVLGTLAGNPTAVARYHYVTDFLASSGLSVLVTPNAVQLPEPGGAVAYTVRVSNDGVADAELDALVDSHAGSLAGLGCPMPQTIASGNVYQCSFSGSVSGNAGDHPSTTVTATGTAFGTPLQSQGDGSLALTDVLPGIELAVVATPSQVGPDGGSVQFDLRVDNTDPAEAVTLNMLGSSLHGSLAAQGSCVLPQAIAIGGHYQCSYSGNVPGAPATQASVVFSAGATDDEANPAPAQDTVIIDIDTRIFANGFES